MGSYPRVRVYYIRQNLELDNSYTVCNKKDNCLFHDNNCYINGNWIQFCQLLDTSTSWVQSKNKEASCKVHAWKRNIFLDFSCFSTAWKMHFLFFLQKASVQFMIKCFIENGFLRGYWFKVTANLTYFENTFQLFWR